MQDETTINPGSPDLTYVAGPSTRQRRRHAAQDVEYKQAIAKQGRRYVKGLSSNPKGVRHIGAKQLAKQLARRNPPAEGPAGNPSSPDKL